MNFIVEDIGKVVEYMREEAGGPPYYIYGHRREISNRLTEMTDDKVRKYKKYPLIALKLDIEEDYRAGLLFVNLNIAILDKTEKNYNAEERKELVFKPVLYPLYEKFMDALTNTSLFYWTGNKRPDHKKIDRYYWGTQDAEGNIKALFNDPLDAVEIVNLKLTQKIKC